MDDISNWLHSKNVDQILDQLGTFVGPTQSSALLKSLVIEEDKLAKHREQLQSTERPILYGKARIARVAGIIDGLIEQGFMNQDKLSKALTVLATMQEAQALLERHYWIMTGRLLA